MKKIITFLTFTLVLLLMSSCNIPTSGNELPANTSPQNISTETKSKSSADLFSGNSDAFCIVNNNVPYFYDCEMTPEPYESYSELDSLGRCGAAVAVIGRENLPTEERGAIGSVKPSGWHTVKYNGIIDGNYLYNRCHLIGYQLSGENANNLNLITGTRYLNVSGMLPFENLVYDHIVDSGNHVLYRVTPKFDKFNLVADGVLIEAVSVEDGGAGLRFCVFCYNVQPGITIDYATGDSKVFDGTPITNNEEPPSAEEDTAAEDDIKRDYILNTGTKRFHLPDCASVSDIKDKNRRKFTGTRQELILDGYLPCQKCDP